MLPRMSARIRQAVRALVVTPDAEVLLIRTAIPHLEGVIWLTPGGGIEPGEDAHGALRREIREETGLLDPTIGPEVWTRCHSYRWGRKFVTQAERYFLVPSARFEPHGRGLPHEEERRDVVGYRWWRLDEICASDERFVPMRLAVHLTSLLQGGPPAHPVDVGG